MAGIGERSDSYPYLALARRLGVDYGAVLVYADWYEQPINQMCEHDYALVMGHLDERARREVRREHEAEKQRREKRRENTWNV